MIFAEDLSKQFEDFWAVDGVNLDVQSGQVLVLLGPNGAGKTTTVRMLTSILVPTRGRASVAGYDVVRQADQVRASVGVLTEHHGLYGRMNGDEYLQFFGRLYGINSDALKPRITSLLEQFGLDFARRKRLGEYSKGMRQKLALVRALLHMPPVLLLDEPTSAMDPESARIVRDGLHNLRSGDRTIVLCTHNLAEAEELADQIAIIRHGKIIIQGTSAEIKQQLLGEPEYEVTLGEHLNGWCGEIPAGTTLTFRDDFHLRFRVNDTHANNPVLLRRLLDDQLNVLTFQEVSQSLEEAYLVAMSHAAEGE